MLDNNILFLSILCMYVCVYVCQKTNLKRDRVNVHYKRITEELISYNMSKNATSRNLFFEFKKYLKFTF